MNRCMKADVTPCQGVAGTWHASYKSQNEAQAEMSGDHFFKFFSVKFGGN